MARSRRPRGLGSDVRGTLGTLVRSTLAQAGVVRDVLERGAREGRARLEEARRDRHRTDALADLGQAVLDLLEAGHYPELLEEPRVSDAVAALEGAEAEPEPAPAAWPSRGERSREPEPDRRGRPTVPGRARPRSNDDDGTVSSAQWRPPAPSRPAAVWRPPVDGDAPAPGAPRTVAAPAPRAPAPPRAGGIQFGGDDDDEAELAEYMHPDDVPPR